MAKSTRTSKVGTDQQVISGIKQDLQTATNLPLGGTSYTPISLVAFLQSHIEKANAVLTAKAAWQDAIKAFTAVDEQAQVVLHDLKALVVATFGATSPQLGDFGYVVKVRKVPTTQEKAAAAAKRTATRAARGTKGPVAKLAVTGETVAAQATADALTAANAKLAAVQSGTANAATTTATTPAPTATVNLVVSATPSTPVTAPAAVNGAQTTTKSA